MASAQKKLWMVVIAAAVVLLAVAAWLWERPKKTPIPQPVPNATAQVKSTPASVVAPRREPGPPDVFKRALDALRAVPDAASARGQLAALRQALSHMSKDEASGAIRVFLDGKSDAPTHLPFKIGAHGLLSEAPSLRAFLLDYLGQSDPAGAAAYARTILSSPDSPDEWAVALRNLALGDTSSDGRALVEEKAGELLRNEAWQQNPATSYLEAFDTAVYLGGTNLTPALADLVRKQDNPAVAHAAYLALDRLVLEEPASLLGALEADPGLMQGREATRANYFARADVRDPQQRQVLENYLLDPRISAAELTQFAGLFPNANYMISQNLLTGNPTPDHAALVGRDAASLNAIQQWLADPRFANLQAPLQQAQVRLAQFVQQAQGR